MTPLTPAEHVALRPGEAFTSAEFDAVVESTILALSEHSTEQLRWVAREAEDRNPEGWLGKMIREYLSVWR